MRVFFGVERQIVGVQGTMCNRIASSEPQWVVAKSEVNNEVIFSFIGYGGITRGLDFAATDYGYTDPRVVVPGTILAHQFSPPSMGTSSRYATITVGPTGIRTRVGLLLAFLHMTDC